MKYLQLIRLFNPFGFYLLFAPALLGLLAGGIMEGTSSIPSFVTVGKFFLGAFLARSGGCIINDFFDRKFDSKVQRTKNRPLATGEVSLKVVFLMAFFLFASAFLILITLPLKAVIACCFAMILVCVYPLVKRFSYFPQVFLGFTYGSPLIVGYLTTAVNPSYNILILYLAVMLWIVIFDTLYAMQDRADDLLIGVKSTAVKFGSKWKIILQFLAIFYFACLLGFWHLAKIEVVLFPTLSYVLLSFIISRAEKDFAKSFKLCLYPLLLVCFGVFINFFKV